MGKNDVKSRIDDFVRKAQHSKTSTTTMFSRGRGFFCQDVPEMNESDLVPMLQVEVMSYSTSEIAIESRTRIVNESFR